MSFTLDGPSAQIRALEVGGSAIPRAYRLDGSKTNKEDIAQVEESLHRLIGPIVTRLQQTTGHVFTTEKIFQATRSRDFIVALCVTRTE